MLNVLKSKYLIPREDYRPEKELPMVGASHSDLSPTWVGGSLELGFMTGQTAIRLFIHASCNSQRDMTG
jgi:hypothetical protein